MWGGCHSISESWSQSTRISPHWGAVSSHFSRSAMPIVRSTDALVWSSWLCVGQLLTSQDEGQITGHDWISFHSCTSTFLPFLTSFPVIYLSRTPDNTYTNPYTGREMLTAVRNHMSRIFWPMWGEQMSRMFWSGVNYKQNAIGGEFHKYMWNPR